MVHCVKLTKERGKIQICNYNCFSTHVTSFIKSREDFNSKIITYSCATVAQFGAKKNFFRVVSEFARSWRKRFRLSAVGVMLKNSFPFSRNICGEQSHVYSIQENCPFQQCNLVVSPMCFLLISLCSGTTAALFTQSQDCGWRQWCYWFIWRFVLHKHRSAAERWMRAVGRRSLGLWGLCHQEACSLLYLWHHCSIPFHRAGTTETPIKLLISCSPSLAHSRLPL